MGVVALHRLKQVSPCWAFTRTPCPTSCAAIARGGLGCICDRGTCRCRPLSPVCPRPRPHPGQSSWLLFLSCLIASRGAPPIGCLSWLTPSVLCHSWLTPPAVRLLWHNAPPPGSPDSHRPAPLPAHPPESALHPLPATPPFIWSPFPVPQKQSQAASHRKVCTGTFPSRRVPFCPGVLPPPVRRPATEARPPLPPSVRVGGWPRSGMRPRRKSRRETHPLREMRAAVLLSRSPDT